MTARRARDGAIYLVFIAVIMALPLFVEDYALNQVARFLVYGILGVAIALSWGYAGVLNLGQGLFFGLGAYMMAMSLKLASNTSLQQGSDKPVPDFMLWNAEPGAKTDLCCISKASFLWIPFQSQWFGLAMAIVAPVAVAALAGSIMFRNRISGVFVSIMTLAMVLLVRLLIIDAQPVTNGFNGLTDLGFFTIGGFDLDNYGIPLYYIVAVVLALTLLLTRLLVETRAGLILQATREDANRCLYLGFDVPMYQTFFFCVSAAIAGIAGLLYANVAQFASPTFMDLSFSISMVVWAAVGGRSSLLGACLGAILIHLLEDTMSKTPALVESWKAIIGLVFVLSVLFTPKGIAGIAGEFADFLARGRLPRVRGASLTADPPRIARESKS